MESCSDWGNNFVMWLSVTFGTYNIISDYFLAMSRVAYWNSKRSGTRNFQGMFDGCWGWCHIIVKSNMYSGFPDLARGLSLFALLTIFYNISIFSYIKLVWIVASCLWFILVFYFSIFLDGWEHFVSSPYGASPSPLHWSLSDSPTAIHTYMY